MSPLTIAASLQGEGRAYWFLDALSAKYGIEILGQLPE